MNDISWVQIISWVCPILSLLGVGTLAGIFWKDFLARKKAKKAEKLDDKKAERQEEIRQVIVDEISSVKADLIEIKKELKLNTNGTLATLRTDIINANDACQKKGYKTKLDAENFRDLCDAYHKLHGNSFIDDDVIPAFNSLELK